MENEALQRFCDDVEAALGGIRGDLLIYQQDSDALPRFAAHTERIGNLCRAIEMCEEAGIEYAIARLHLQTSSMLSITGRLPAEDVRSVLDRISDIESKIALVRMSDEGFSDELDRLLDASLGSIRTEIEPSNAVSATAPDPADEDRFEIDDELLNIFAGEADELLENIERNLHSLASDPANKESLWEIRRSAHTFKGSSGLVGLMDASRLAHRIEDLLEDLSGDPSRTAKGIVPVLLAANECLRELTARTRRAGLDRALAKVHEDLDRLSGDETVSHHESEPSSANAANTQQQPQSSTTISQTAKPIVRVPLEQLDALVDLVRELVVNRSVIGQRFAEFDRQVDELHNTSRRLRSINSRLEVDLSSALFDVDNTYRTKTAVVQSYTGQPKELTHDHFNVLEIDRYSELHESVRDLTETASDTAAIDQSVEALKEQMGSLLQQQRTLFDDVQSRVMSMRMISFDTLRTRLERAVRVTCEDEKKQSTLSIENGEVPLDTQMLDEIVEPLLHLLKNAIVHGIESPETRRLLGKSEAGNITVRVDNQDTHVTITISDDGSGIAVNTLKERAIACGAITRDSVATLSDHQAMDLIFTPGLTTARRLNLNAGRGVGMNIVKESIEANRGTISVASEPQKGTRFTIRLPLKLAVTNALLVSSAGGIYAIPLKHIERIVEIGREELVEKNGQFTWEISGHEYSLHRLDESLGITTTGTPVPALLTALLLKGTARNLAVAVQGVIRTEEVVIKPLAKPFDGIRETLGIAFLSSGELAPILDLPYLFGRSVKQRVERTAAPTAVKKTFIMVVDDSPSVRHMTSKVIRNAGWDVITAKDGLDALDILNGKTKLPDLILTDIEMPRMGGIELAEVLQNDTRKNTIPVVIITSRTAEKHRQRARENGIDAYLVKPYEESELIRLVRELTAATYERFAEPVLAT